MNHDHQEHQPHPATSAELEKLTAALAGIVEESARNNPGVRQGLHLLRDWLSNLLEGAEPRASARAERPASAPQVVPAPAPPLPLHPVTLNLGGTIRTMQMPGTAEDAAAARKSLEIRSNGTSTHQAAYVEDIPGPDLSLVASRCRVKAEGCRWAIERRRLKLAGADHDLDVKPTDLAIIARAKALRSCYVWPMDPATVVPPDDTLNLVAELYENLTRAAELTQRVFEGGSDIRGARPDAYLLLAEAQSAVRIALLEVNVYKDSDQNDAFLWLRERTYTDQVHVPRFMRLEDPADPDQWRGLRERIHEVRAQLDHQKGRETERQQLLKKARFHARKIERAGAGDDLAPDWQTLFRALEELLGLGVPPSDITLRDLLLPIFEAMPEDLAGSEGVERVLDEVDRFLAAREQAQQDDPRPSERRSAAVIEAAELVRGGVVVLIGGQRRMQAAQALERELELAELRWVTAGHHESLYNFEPAIARPDTTLVLLAIRWSSHSFDGVRAFCERHGKPLVRLPGGYSPNQVADQILRQVSGRLQQAR